MSFRRRSVWIAWLLLNRRCWNCRGTVRLIGREFRALATLLHRSGTRTRPPHPRARAAAGADRDPAPARPRGREQTAGAGPALRDLSLVAARHARKLGAVSPHATPMVQLSLVPAAPRPRCDLLFIAGTYTPFTVGQM